MNTEEAKTITNLLEHALSCIGPDDRSFNLIRFRDNGQRQLYHLIIQNNGSVSCDLVTLVNESDRELVINSLATLCGATSLGPTYLISEQRRATFSDIRKAIGIVLSCISLLISDKKQPLNNEREIIVFYSWQSDLPTKDNRNFIESALNSAIKSIKQKALKPIKIVLDKDTLGEPGSPDIFNAIREKISRSAVFVCDVTPITVFNGKSIPNPNVLIELGYAFSSLTDSRIIMVTNNTPTALPAGMMPFDLQTKRQLRYSFSDGASRSEIKRGLTISLAAALESVFRNDSDLEVF